jgi:hypothetical protein
VSGRGRQRKRFPNRIAELLRQELDEFAFGGRHLASLSGRHERTEIVLMVIDDLVERGIAWHDDRDESRSVGIGDRSRAHLGDSHVGELVLPAQVRCGHHAVVDPEA